jgi:hypothetical protein
VCRTRLMMSPAALMVTDVMMQPRSPQGHRPCLTDEVLVRQVGQAGGVLCQGLDGPLPVGHRAAARLRWGGWVRGGVQVLWELI